MGDPMFTNIETNRLVLMSKTPEALLYFEEVHPKGKVIIVVEQNGK
jgi:hypothetical protein